MGKTKKCAKDVANEVSAEKSSSDAFALAAARRRESSSPDPKNEKRQPGSPRALCPYQRAHQVRIAGTQWMYTLCTLSCEWNTSELRHSGIAHRIGPLAYAKVVLKKRALRGRHRICQKCAALA